MRKLMLFVCGFACGCALCVYGLPAAMILIGAAICAGLTGIGFLLRRRIPAWLRIPVLGLTVGLLWAFAYGSLWIEPVRKAVGSQPELQAEACDYSRPTTYGFRVDAYVRTEQGTFKARLYYKNDPGQIQPGDRISGEFELELSDRSSGGEELNRALLARGIPLTGTGKISAVNRPVKAPVRYLPVRIGARLRQSLRDSVPADASPFLQAIFTGDKTELSYGTQSDLTDAGLSHVVAVSGMHVGILMGFVLFFFGFGKKRTLLLTVPLLLFYVLMTGASASVIRASVMLLLIQLAPIVKRENDPLTTLSAAALWILGTNPWSLAGLSFQLSFAAMTGIILFSGPMYESLSKSRPWVLVKDWVGIKRGPLFLAGRLTKLCKRLSSGCLAILCATVGALLLTTPIVALQFGRFSTYTLLSNLLTLWAIPLCFAGALLTSLTGLLYPPAGRLLGGLAAWPVRYVLWVSHWISGLPAAVMPISSPYVIAFLAFVYLVAVLVIAARRKRFGMPLLCVLTALCASAAVFCLDASAGRLTIAVLDVGQGQCVFLRSKGYTAMIDCGGTQGDPVGDLAAEKVKQGGSAKLDALILSHYDQDHVNGVPELLRQIRVDTVYLPDVSFEPETRAELEQAIAGSGARIVYVTEDCSIQAGEGSLTVFAPVSTYDSNAASLAVLFSSPEYGMLVTGDLDRYSEYDLLLSHSLPRVNLLVAGHHGSGGSTSEELLEAILPEAVAISVGKNSYGHPAQETLDRIAKIRAAVYRTDQNGEIVIRR